MSEKDKPRTVNPVSSFGDAAQRAGKFLEEEGASALNKIIDKAPGIFDAILSGLDALGAADTVSQTAGTAAAAAAVVTEAAPMVEDCPRCFHNGGGVPHPDCRLCEGHGKVRVR